MSWLTIFIILSIVLFLFAVFFLLAGLGIRDDAELLRNMVERKEREAEEAFDDYQNVLKKYKDRVMDRDATIALLEESIKELRGFVPSTEDLLSWKVNREIEKMKLKEGLTDGEQANGGRALNSWMEELDKV